MIKHSFSLFLAVFGSISSAAPSLKDPLLQPLEINSAIRLHNRIAMAPMTRCFATNNIPSEEMARYYARRNDAGLIISEATMVGPHASGYPDTPGIYSQEQINGWKNVIKHVHQGNAKFFLQLWHAGMMSHPHYRDGKEPLAPSAIPPLRKTIPRTNGKLSYGKPKPMDEKDMNEVILEFAQAAANALDAGADGVEIHASNGYLLDSFLHYHTNRRTDAYGGSPMNMCRFVLEVIDAVMSKVGNQKLAIRLSPVPVPSMANMEEDIRDQAVFVYLLSELEKRRIAYVHVSVDDDIHESGQLGMPVSAFVRKHYKGFLIGCGSYDLISGRNALRENKFDIIAYGRLFIANPDLVKRAKDRTQPPIASFEGAMLQNLD